MVRLLALVLSALLALPAVGQLQTQPTGLKKMDGSDSGGGGGSGDVTSVAATANTPLSVSGSPCTSGACAFTFTLGTVTIAKGGTNITSYTLGDLLYSSATNTLAKLAGNTTTTKMFLMQAGDGVASAAPAWTATAADFPTLNQNTSGLAGTATALAADPADCSAGQYASSINASGTLGCAQVAYSQVSSTPVIGTNTQAWDADLDGLAGLGNGYPYRAAATWAVSSPTSGYLPVPNGSGLTASQVQVVDANTIRSAGVTQQTEVCPYYVSGSDYACARMGSLSASIMQFGSYSTGASASSSQSLAVGVITGAGDLRLYGAGALRVRVSALGITFEGTDTYDFGAASGLAKHVYTSRGIQGSKSKALVDATATDVWQVAVANNSYEGLSLDYTIFATDGSDRQTLQGTVKVAINNNAGTETCVFSTPSEAVNPSTGTLAVTWDCTAGTNTVMIRANADTSLASTTTFTIESRPNLTSGTATVTPQ